MSAIYDPTLNIMSSLSTLFNQDDGIIPTLNKKYNGQPATVDNTPVEIEEEVVDEAPLPGQQFSRRDIRRLRKSMGMDKQQFRNWQAKQLGYDTSNPNFQGGISRRELSNMRQASGISKQDARHLYVKNNFIEDKLAQPIKPPTLVETLKPNIPNTIETKIELPAPSVSPITYNWGDTVNSYWQGQNEKVLNSLSDEERRKIAGDDGVITADEAKTWQTGMGLSGDLKFGSGTIGAATSKYGNSFNASGFKGYINPGNTQTKDNGSPVKSTSGNPVHTNNGTSINTTGTGVMGSTNLMYEWGKKINNWWNSL